jgi:ABC-type multidrug transport system ATPase subunit
VDAAMAAIRPLMDRFQLTAEIDHIALEYSRGTKKKLGLLLALLHHPKSLILDEPTNGLDVEATHLFYDLIGSLAAEGNSVLFSTHLMDHVTRLCSHFIVIYHGTVVAKDMLRDLRAAYGDTSLEELFLDLTHDPSP